MFADPVWMNPRGQTGCRLRGCVRIPRARHPERATGAIGAETAHACLRLLGGASVLSQEKGIGVRGTAYLSPCVLPLATLDSITIVI